jgi:hypothetical protein
MEVFELVALLSVVPDPSVLGSHPVRIRHPLEVNQLEGCFQPPSMFSEPSADMQCLADVKAPTSSEEPVDRGDLLVSFSRLHAFLLSDPGDLLPPFRREVLSPCDSTEFACVFCVHCLGLSYSTIHSNSLLSVTRDVTPETRDATQNSVAVRA